MIASLLREPMSVFLAVILGILALTVAAVASWFAYQASERAERISKRVDRANTSSKASLRSRAPVAERGQRAAREHSWRDSTPEDAPEWFRKMFEGLRHDVQSLMEDVGQLREEAQRAREAMPIHTDDLREVDTWHQSPAARGQPVDLRDGVVVPSRSLAATGSLVLGNGDAPALLYLNESIEIDHLSQERWSQYFDFGNGDPYRRYRTLEPSHVDWNAALEQGRLLERGRVEAV